MVRVPAYLTLADEAATAWTRAASSLAAMGEIVTDLRSYVAWIERMLAEVS